MITIGWTLFLIHIGQCLSKVQSEKKRGEGNALEIAINGPSTPVPKPWKKYNSKSRNKTNLLSPPLSWRKTAMEQLPQGKNLVIGGGLRNGKLACLLMRRGSAEFVRPLNADHKGADTRLLLHAKHATKDVAGVVIQSPDNDVLVLSVSHYKEIGSASREQWFWTGFKDGIIYIPVHKIAARLGTQLCKAIPAFHALTRCDSMSSLSGTGKRNAWKVLRRDIRHPVIKLSTVWANVRFRRENRRGNRGFYL